MTDRTKMVLRYYIGFEKTQERFEMLEDFMRGLFFFLRLSLSKARLFLRNITEGTPECFGLMLIS